jgi:hypothetical protein
MHQVYAELLSMIIGQEGKKYSASFLWATLGPFSNIASKKAFLAVL